MTSLPVESKLTMAPTEGFPTIFEKYFYIFWVDLVADFFTTVKKIKMAESFSIRNSWITDKVMNLARKKDRCQRSAMDPPIDI